MTRLRRCLAVLLLPLSAHALTLRTCADVREHPPFLTKARDGLIDRLVARAADEAGLSLDYQPNPVARCREMLRAGQLDAWVGVAYAEANRPILAFPMREGVPDEARSIGATAALVFRRKGSAAQWDGQRFSQLRHAVLAPFGSALILEKLASMHIETDAGAQSTRANFNKLAAGRAELAIGLALESKALLQLPEYADKIEVLKTPFMEGRYYLAVTRPVYEAHRSEIEALWNAIGRLRASADYQRREREAAAAPTAPPAE